MTKIMMQSRRDDEMPRRSVVEVLSSLPNKKELPSTNDTA